jgi:8-amino-7-oxononanoate synthase
VALLVNSGWDLNFGMLTSVVDSDTFVVYDELSHNSLLMGIRAGKAGSTAFRHNDMEALRRQLEASRDRPEKLVVVEAVYSMDGDIAPIQTVLDLAAEFGAHVLVDEAHSTGMLGARGEGLVVSQGLQGHSALLGCVHTFGKALGQHGAVLVTPHASLKQFLVNYCTPLIYSTAMPISSLVAVQASYAFCADSSAERQNLQSLIAHFRKQAVQLDLPTLESNTAIQGVLVPGNAAVLEASKQLQSLGLGCLPIRAPTVAAGTERIRVVLHAHNTEQQVDLLCSSIARILQNNA